MPGSLPLENNPKALGLGVANLRFWLIPQNTDYLPELPNVHRKFLITSDHKGPYLIREGDLLIQLKNEFIFSKEKWGKLICGTKIWELWQSKDDSYIFVVPNGLAPKYLVITQDFKHGQFFIENLINSSDEPYPLKNLDNLLFVNWLGNYGDIMLHASGIVVDKKAYAFIGPAGIGKSTIVNELSIEPSVTVIGEDTIILRHLNDNFWTFGTPWHLNPEMCSPLGAPLERLYFLERNPVEQVLKLSPQEGISRILQTAFIPYYRSDLMHRILDRLILLSEEVPFYSLSFNLGTDVWQLINEG